MKAHGEDSVELAFTVDPNTKIVNCVYVTSAGWDAQIVFSLSSALQTAGWEIYSVNGKLCAEDTVSVTYNDADAKAIGGQAQSIVLYNERLKEVSCAGLNYSVAVNKGAAQNITVTAGKTSAISITPDVITKDQKTYKYEIDGLVIGDVTVTVNNEGLKMSALKKSAFEDVVLGTSLTVVVTPKEGQFEDGGKAVNPTLYRWKATYTEPWANIVNTVYGTLDSTSTYVTVTFVPVSGDRAATNGTAVLSGVDWVGYPNT